MMKKVCLLFVFLAGSYCIYAQEEKNIVDLMIECYEEYYDLNKREETKLVPIEEKTCPSEPDNFHDFFKTTVIDFASLREGHTTKTFSFSDNLCSPLKHNLIVTSGYGMREGSKHFGTDFRLNVGDSVCSVFCGRVRIVNWDNGYGNVIVIRNYNMSETVYAHLSKTLVSVDQEVKAGEIIGLGGRTGRSTGPHLHFELRYKGYPINPIVNNKFLNQIPVVM